MASLKGKTKVAAIVLNSVSHDARVLKEASSLAEVGYQVTLIGIRDKKCAEPKTFVGDNVTIYRMDLNSLIASLKIRATCALLSALLVIVLLISFTLSAYYLSGTSQHMLALTAAGIMALLLLITLASLLYSARIKRAKWLSQFSHLDAQSHERRTRPELLLQIRLFLRTASRSDRPYLHTAFRFVRCTKKYVRKAVLKSANSTLYFIKPLLRPFVLYFKWKACLQTSIRQLNTLDPDFIHCHDLTTLRIGTAYKKANPGTKVIFDSHELYEEVANMKPSLRRYWKRVARNHSCHVDGFITVNQSIADELKKRYPKLPEPVVVCNAVELAGAFPTYDGRLHHAAEVPLSMKVLLYQGGFSPHRGLEILVEAAAKLPDDWVLVMMGWGNLEPHLRKLSNDADPSGSKIRFLPPAPQSELRAWTTGASLGAIPYENVCMNHWFCSPNKLWEYPASGVPILASPFPELHQRVIGEGIGIELSEPQTAADIAAKVSALTESKLNTMKKNCARFIDEDNWSTYSRRLQSLYNDLT